MVLSSILMEEADPEKARDQRYLQKLVEYVRRENEMLEREGRRRERVTVTSIGEFNGRDTVGGEAERFFTDPDRQAIQAVDSSFSYPQHVISGVNAFGDYEGRHSPVLKTGYECCQALLFERRGQAV